ncbi:MAG: thiamine pyrophosphate-binding protein [Candidatus Hodarchaeales archaeon]|jgi:acetolactate synthase-1/2/3 large subunit
MGLINGGALFGKALKNEGIEKAFTLVGGHIMPILHGMRNEGIEITDMRHECAAMYAAIACARASGKPVVVVTTAGPGVLNTVAGMLEAQGCCMPIIHIGGAATMDGLKRGELQDQPTLQVQETCSKWAHRITNPASIPYFVAMALRHAMDGTPGSVYLEVPVDIVHRRVNEKKVEFPVNSQAKEMPCGDAKLIEAAADLLVNSKCPMAIIGDGARFSIQDHASDISALSDYLKMPLRVRGSACKGLFGDEYKNLLFRSGGLLEADVVLSMGIRFDFGIGYGRIFQPKTKIIQVHTDSTQIGFNLRADIGIIGGAGAVAKQLLDAVKEKKDKSMAVSWANQPKTSVLESLSEKCYTEGSPIHPSRLVGEVVKFLAGDGKDWDFVLDGGDISVHMWDSGAMLAHRPGQIHTGSPNGMIGMGPGQVVGTWIANRKPVLLLTGDGSFGFYSMEVDTMARLGIPAVVVISNDGAWGMIRLDEKHTTPEEVEARGHCNTELLDGEGNIRAYEKMVAMWGGHGEMVCDPEEIIPAIKRAAANGKPSIINVEVDREALSSWTQRTAGAAAQRSKK